MTRKVMITGIGLVTPCGNGKDAAWTAVKAGKSGVGRITRFDALRCTAQVAGEVRGFEEYFMKMKALCTAFNDDPQRASRPFNLDRSGFVMGEGAGILVLESEEHARARKARVYCELAGYGATSDAYHITAPDPSGAGAVEAAFCALAMHEGFVPPTINYETPDPECDLDYTPNEGVAMPIRAALSTSLGFGGYNGALTFRGA